MAADGQIVLGLNVSATTAQISADLSTILDGLGTKQLILKAAIEKSQVEKSVASLVKEINQETAKIGIEVDPKSVSKVISQQQKMASMQKELVQQMDRYKQAASDVGLTLKVRHKILSNLLLMQMILKQQKKVCAPLRKK